MHRANAEYLIALLDGGCMDTWLAGKRCSSL
jgi:hypothetical protein